MPNGITKRTAVKYLCDLWKIPPESAAAFGDNYNDVEMLRAAAKAFVPANGDPYAMACADYVVRSNEEDAVAHVVEILTEIYRSREGR